MAHIAARGAWMLGRRFAGPALRYIGRGFGRSAARGIAARGASIPLRTMGRSAVARSGGFNQIRRMGTAAFSTPTRAPRIQSGILSAPMKRAAKFGMFGTALGAAEFASHKRKRAKKDGSKRQETRKGEQVLAGDKGDGLETTDTFNNNTGNPSWKNAALVSGKQTLIRSSTGGIKGTAGRAVWGSLGDWQKPGDYLDIDKKFTTVWRAATGTTSTPGWIKGDDLNQTTGFTQRKFVYEKLHSKWRFKNQSSSPTHFEYFILTPHETDENTIYWQNDFVNGYLKKLGGNANKATVAGAGTGQLVTTPIDYHFGQSIEFKRKWKILYSHKVLLAEGQMHVFDFNDNANRLIDLAKLPSGGNGQMRNMTKYFAYKVYGDIGDTSNAMTTIGDVTTAPSKIIFHQVSTEYGRTVLTTPKLLLDETTDLIDEPANLYDKDPSTGAVEDVNIE